MRSLRGDVGQVWTALTSMEPAISGLPASMKQRNPRAGV